MPKRLIRMLAANFDVIWTDSSPIKICILYPFRNLLLKRCPLSAHSIGRCLWRMATVERKSAKRKFEIQCFPGDLRWINIPFSMCSYLNFFYCSTAIWKWRQQHKREAKDYLWSRRDLCVNVSRRGASFIVSTSQQLFMLLEFLSDRTAQQQRIEMINFRSLTAANVLNKTLIKAVYKVDALDAYFECRCLICCWLMDFLRIVESN